MSVKPKSNYPVLPTFKISAIRKGAYVYLYSVHETVGQNGRSFVKAPKSAGKLKLEEISNKLLVVWQDWFLNENPSLRAFNTYFNEGTLSKHDLTTAESFSFTAKAGEESANSMNRPQYYESGLTWSLDQMLLNSPLIFALNNKFLKQKLTSQIISLTYFVTCTNFPSFQEYCDFTAMTRLACPKPLNLNDIAAVLRQLGWGSLGDFREDLYQRTYQKYSSKADFWVVDTEFPYHVLKRLSEGKDFPSIERNQELVAKINRFKSNKLFIHGNDLYNYKRLLQMQPTRIMSVINLTDGFVCSYTTYNAEQVTSSDIATYIQDCSMWNNQPHLIYNDFKSSSTKHENLNQEAFRVLTEEQLGPKLNELGTSFQDQKDPNINKKIKPLYPSNLNVPRSTVVINNNLVYKDRNTKTISRPVSGILPADKAANKYANYSSKGHPLNVSPDVLNLTGRGLIKPVPSTPKSDILISDTSVKVAPSPADTAQVATAASAIADASVLVSPSAQAASSDSSLEAKLHPYPKAHNLSPNLDLGALQDSNAKLHSTSTSDVQTATTTVSQPAVSLESSQSNSVESLSVSNSEHTSDVKPEAHTESQSALRSKSQHADKAPSQKELQIATMQESPRDASCKANQDTEQDTNAPQASASTKTLSATTASETDVVKPVVADKAINGDSKTKVQASTKKVAATKSVITRGRKGKIVSTYEFLSSAMKELERDDKVRTSTPLTERCAVDSGSNEREINVNVTQLQQDKTREQEEQEEERKQSLKQEQERHRSLIPESAFDFQGKNNGKEQGNGVLVTDRCQHVLDNFEFYQNHRLPFLLQILPDSELYKICLNALSEELIQDAHYDPVLNRCTLSVNLFEHSETYTEILGAINKYEQDAKEKRNKASKSDKDIVRPKVKATYRTDLFDDFNVGTTSDINSLLDIDSEVALLDSNYSNRNEVHVKARLALTLHICFDIRELIKLDQSLEDFENTEEIDRLFDQSEFEEAKAKRSNNFNLKKNIVEKVTGRLLQKPYYSLTQEQRNLVTSLDDYLQKRNHVLEPKIAENQRRLRASKALKSSEARALMQPPRVTQWTASKDCFLKDFMRCLLKTELPRSVLQISLSNSIHKIDDALLACHVLETQHTLYERLSLDILQQELRAESKIQDRLHVEPCSLELQGKEFIWFLALNMKLMFAMRLEKANRNSGNLMLEKSDVLTPDDIEKHLRMIVSTRKTDYLEYDQNVNTQQQMAYLDYLGLKQPSVEYFSKYIEHNQVPMQP